MSTSGESLNASDARFLVSIIHHIKDDGKINWDGVALDNGIGYARNAPPRFNRIAAAHGFKHEGGKCVKTEDFIAAPATPKTPRKRASKKADGAATAVVTPKKRKVQSEPIVAADDDDQD